MNLSPNDYYENESISCNSYDKSFSRFVLITSILFGLLFMIGMVSGAVCNTTGNIINSTSISNGCTLDVAGTYTMSGETFNLNGSSGNGAIKINSSNIILNGNGSILYYANNNVNSLGISNNGFDNITLSNFSIIEGGVLNTSRYGIQFLNSSGNRIINLTLITLTNSSHAILFQVNSNSNLFYNNKIYTSGYQAYDMLIQTANNNISNNYVSTNGSLSYGIHLETSGSYNNYVEYNTINNTINTASQGNIGIFLEVDSRNNFINFNNIITNNNQSHGIELDTNVSYNSIFSNNINVNGTGSRGIYLIKSLRASNLTDSTSGNNITYNNIVGGTIELGNNLTDNNLIKYNNITTYLSSSYGILLTDYAKNNIFNNNFINTSGSSSIGIFLTTFSSNNLFYNNNVYTYGSNARAYRFDNTNTSGNYINNSYFYSKQSNGVLLNGISSGNVFTNIIIDSASNGFSLNSNDINISIINITYHNLSSNSYLVDIGSSKRNIILNSLNSLGKYNLNWNVSTIINLNSYILNSINQSRIENGNNWFSILNKNNTITSIYNLGGLSNTLIYTSNGSAQIVSGNINITLQPNNYSYVLDNFNLTEGITRLYSPISFAQSTLSEKTIHSDLIDSVAVDTIMTVDTCESAGNIKINGVVYQTGDYSCSGNQATFSGLTLLSGDNLVELDYSCSSFTTAGYKLIMIIASLLIVAVFGMYIYSKGLESWEVKDLVLAFAVLMIVVTLWMSAGQMLGSSCPVVT